MERLQAFCLLICKKILSTVDDPRYQSHEKEDSSSSPTVQTNLESCGPAVVDLIRRQAFLICQRHGDTTLIMRRLDDLLSLAKAKFYAFPFKDVPLCWRQLFTDASILKACNIVFQGKSNAAKLSFVLGEAQSVGDDLIEDIVKTLDLAVIMSGAPGAERLHWIESIMELLEPLCEPFNLNDEVRPPKRRKLGRIVENDEFSSSNVFVPQAYHPVARVSALSLRAFEKRMQSPKNPNIGPEPLIIQESIEHWPARHDRPWKRPSYLLSQTLNGHRLVPIEVGRSYVDDGWGQKIITFRDFMEDYLLRDPDIHTNSASGQMARVMKQTQCDPKEDILPQSSSIGYLAQHDLFTQVPSLRADIFVPDYCYGYASSPHPSSPLADMHSAIPELETPILNAWFGPAGTISPMHVDPYHNILAQVVGRKYVRLYAPKESAKLYARGVEDSGVDMSNTSALDIGVLEGWDGTKPGQKEAAMKYPLYPEAEFVDLILEEGECLYIPVGWWHYVRSLSISFSVSFWWN